MSRRFRSQPTLQRSAGPRSRTLSALAVAVAGLAGVGLVVADRSPDWFEPRRPAPAQAQPALQPVSAPAAASAVPLAAVEPPAPPAPPPGARRRARRPPPPPNAMLRPSRTRRPSTTGR